MALHKQTQICVVFSVYKLEPLSSFQSLFLFSEDYSVRVLTDLQQISATDTNSIWKYLSYIGSALKKAESVCINIKRL